MSRKAAIVVPVASVLIGAPLLELVAHSALEWWKTGARGWYSWRLTQTPSG